MWPFYNLPFPREKLEKGPLLRWLIQQQNGNVSWRRRAQSKQLAWPIAERQIDYRKSRLVLSACFPVVNWRSHSVAKSAFSRGGGGCTQANKTLNLTAQNKRTTTKQWLFTSVSRISENRWFFKLKGSAVPSSVSELVLAFLYSDCGSKFHTVHYFYIPLTHLNLFVAEMVVKIIAAFPAAKTAYGTCKSQGSFNKRYSETLLQCNGNKIS